MKVYPLKPPLPAWEDELCNVCECGHIDVFHGTENPECDVCCCPKYKFEQILTHAKANDLSDYIENQALKTDYVS